jgi:urea transporter
MNQINNFRIWILGSYSSILFSSNQVVGFLVLLLSFLNPSAGFMGLLGNFLILLFAKILGVHEDRILKGPYGFNGLLFGLSLSLYHDIDINLITLLIAGVVLLLFLTILLEHIFGYFFGLPVLSLPFVLMSIVIYFSQFNYSGFLIKTNQVYSFNSYFPVLPLYIELYFKSLGGIFFQTSPWAGFFLAILILFSSRISFILSILGYTFAVLFHLALKGSLSDLNENNIGFNFILTSIAVGGFFLVPSKGSFLLGILASIVSGVIASFAKIFLIQFFIPVLALPFNTTTLLFLYVAKLLHNRNYIPVDFTPGSPEQNLDYYKTRLERFGYHGLYIRLPFSGKWTVSQGYSGDYTHKDKWKESLDFMAVDSENKIRKNSTELVTDFYTFGLPVLSVGSGRVVKVVNHIDDNELYKVDIQNNWGNLVLIEHSIFLYSQVSHLQKNSILVKEGDYVTAGTKLGLAGNSGRSPLPHIHLHFQATPEIGSSTIPISFTQYLDETKINNVKFNSIPEEQDILSHINSDFNLKNFYSIIPGQEYKIQFQKSGKMTNEVWKAKLDFWGFRFLEDDKLNRLYFYITQDSFSCIDYQGSKESSLYYFFLTSYRVPFVSMESIWQDKISYKFFSNSIKRFFKDLVQPLSDRFSYDWKAEIRTLETGLEINSEIISKDQKILSKQSIKLESTIPGEIKFTDHLGQHEIQIKGLE